MANAEQPSGPQSPSTEMPRERSEEGDSTAEIDNTRPKSVSVEYLRQCLTEVEGKTAAKRIMVGINHKEGVPQTELADWYNVSRTTIHNWLDRLERLSEEPLEEVVYDDERPGRPSKLDSSQQKQLAEVLKKPPKEAGYKAPEWTPKLAQAYIEEMFHVEYTLSYVREILHEAGVSWNTSQTRSQDDTHVEKAIENGTGSNEDSNQWVHGCRR